MWSYEANKKMLIQINKNLVATTENSILVHNFQGQTEAGAKMSLLFGVDNTSSFHVDNKNKNSLVLGKRPPKT